MALTEYRVGALCVVEDTRDVDWINRALKRISERLFVEKQMTFADEEVWCVVEDTGGRYGAERYVTVHEFRDRKGAPIPYLTDRIVEEMERRAREGTGNVLAARKVAERRNRERLERLARDRDEAMHDIAADFEKHRRIGNFAVVPRSQQLRISRARARSTRNEQMAAVAQAAEIARALQRRGARAALTA